MARVSSWRGLWTRAALVYRRIDVEVYRKSTGRDLQRQ